MNDKDLLKELESLKKRVSELESQKKSNLNMFGRSYNQVGNSNSDFLIKTKGQIKIQWGNKFIDLIKDGKINVNAQFVYQQDSVGSKDGIYVIGEEDKAEIWLVVGESSINLKGEVGNTYVSFLSPQQTSPEQKYQALTNIGFLYKDINAVDETGVKSGIVYIESEKKLYVIEDGIASEFTISLPNPFTDQFVIAKQSQDKGALVIQGYGINNSLAFTDLCIYQDETNSYFDSNNIVHFKIEEKDVLVMSKATSTFFNDVISQGFESHGATQSNGFRLYMAEGISILEVDKIVVRQGESGLTVLYPQYWFGSNGIIKSIKELQTDTSEELENQTFTFELHLNQSIDINIGDTFILYAQEERNEQVEDSDGNTYNRASIHLMPIYLNVQDVAQDETIIVNSPSEILSNKIQSVVGKFIFKISSQSEQFCPIRIDKNSIDIIQYDTQQLNLQENIHTRIGDLSIIKDGEKTLNGNGIYTDRLFIGGDQEENFPKYTETLNSLVSQINIESSTDYDCVLISVGLLKQVLRENQNSINQLKEKIVILETNITQIKEQLEK